MNNNPRNRLIDLLTTYLNKPHIMMKGPMRYYLERLQDGQNLKPSHFQTIVPYLKWDLKMTEPQIRLYFSELIGSQKPMSTPNNLEQFI